MKLAITGFFLSASFWVTYLIFMRGLAPTHLQMSVDSHTEDRFMILLVCTLLSAVGVLFLGLLSLFTHFVFVRLVYSDDIKIAAISMIRNKRKDNQAKRKAKNAQVTKEIKPEQEVTTELIKS